MGLSVLVVFKQLFAVAPVSCYWIIGEGVCYIGEMCIRDRDRECPQLPARLPDERPLSGKSYGASAGALSLIHI